MQNKTALWVFITLLTAACIYQISFTFMNMSVEKEAKKYAEAQYDSIDPNKTMNVFSKDTLIQKIESQYLRDIASETRFGSQVSSIRKKQIDLGLDLQGGMNVTLEVSLVDLIKNFSSNPQDPSFNKAIAQAMEMQKNSSEDFITLFGKAYKSIEPNSKLAAIFYSRENQNLIPRDATDEDVLKTLKKEAGDAVKRTENVLRKRIDNLGVVQPKIQRLESGRILVELPGVREKERVRKILQGTAKLEFWETYDVREVFDRLVEFDKILALREKSKDSVTTTVADTTQEAKADSTSDVLKKLMAENKSTTDSAKNGERRPLFEVVQPPQIQNNDKNYYCFLYALTKDTAKANTYLNDPELKEMLPNVKFMWDNKDNSEDPNRKGDAKPVITLYLIKAISNDGNAPMDGSAITDANPNFNQMINKNEVILGMNSDGAKKWRVLTKENIGKSIAISLDNAVYSAPVVQGEISGGSTSITGNFSVEEATDLSNILKAGKLPAPAKIIEFAEVGPTLGQDNINAGFMSFIIALVVAWLYLIFYYSKGGVIADLTLVINMFFVVGILTSIGATLTLAGIAGIVLTIGMAVDANVLIYERIREEMSNGKNLRSAVQEGFRGSLSAIMDANITALLTGIVLYIFGTGPIQGFATTLIIGIITSVFSAVVLSRLVIEWMLDRKKEISFESRITKNWFKNMNVNFLKHRKYFYIGSIILSLISIGSLAYRGLDWGVDFSGGRTYQVKFENPVDANKVSDLLANYFVEDGKKEAPEVKTYGTNGYQVLITTKYMINDNSQDAHEKSAAVLSQGLNALNNKFDIVKTQMVGPTVADDIYTNALIAVGLALLIIFGYVAVRFRKWQYGMGAVASLFHDVLMVTGMFSLFYGILPFSLEIDQNFVAAILTILGYSVNDSVVIFDRIREFKGLYGKEDKMKVVNNALNSTLSRTFNTALSTFIILILIFVFGGDSMRGFVFALLLGIFVGTYSSLFIATPIMYDLDKDNDGASIKVNKAPLKATVA